MAFDALDSLIDASWVGGNDVGIAFGSFVGLECGDGVE